MSKVRLRNTMIPEIVQVVPNNNYTVTVYFDVGKIVLYDVSPLLEKEIFLPLKDMENFMNTCTNRYNSKPLRTYILGGFLVYCRRLKELELTG